ncbi:MAG: hypothetical protein ACP5NX_02520 [Candidatus Bilamarchaeaceae archaeon]
MAPADLTRTDTKPKIPADALKNLRDRFGGRADIFAESVLSAATNQATVDQMIRGGGDLLKMQPSEEMIWRVTKVVDRALNDKIDVVIANMSLSKIAIFLQKRNEESLGAMLNAFKDLSKTNPILFMGALNDQKFSELLFFSPEGLKEWVDDGKAKFCVGGNVSVSEFYRYVAMCAGYSDVAKYKISENAVFLENIQEALTLFAMQQFDKRLIATKSRTHVPHVTETDDIKIFLPDYVGYFDVKEKNELMYFKTALHEATHIVKGSFVLNVYGMLDILETYGVKIKKLELKPHTLKIGSMMVEKDGKEYACLSMFHLLSFIGEKGHAKYLQTLWNILEDLRDDSYWLDDRAPGYAPGHREDMLEFMKKHRKMPEKLTATGFVECLLRMQVLLSASMDRKTFMDAVKDENVEPVDETEREMAKHMRAFPPDVLALVLEFEEDLMALTSARENNCDRSFRSMVRIYERTKHLIEDAETNDAGKNGEGLEGMNGPISISEINPEDISLDFDPKSEMDPQDLPDELKEKMRKAMKEKMDKMTPEERKKFEDRMKEALKNMKPGDRDKLMGAIADGLGNKNDGKEGQAGAGKKGEEDKGSAPNQAKHIPGRWDIELVNNVEMLGYCTIHEERLPDGRADYDPDSAAAIRNLASRLMVERIRESDGGMAGEVDPNAKLAWKMERRRGLILPREYHIETEHSKVRSISILVLGDCSGSTAGRLNGQSKIDYINNAVNTLGSGLSGIPGLYFADAFFNSKGRENVFFYTGKGFKEQFRFVQAVPNHANRDGAAYRKAGEVLSKQNTDVKLLIMVNDSMPADADDYNGRRGVEDVRHALTELHKHRIMFHAITAPPDETYYHDQFRSIEDYLTYLYLDRRNWSRISSEKDLPPAFITIQKMALKRLRRTVME